MNDFRGLIVGLRTILCFETVFWCNLKVLQLILR